MDTPFKLISLFLALTILIISLNGVILATEGQENEDKITRQHNIENLGWFCPSCGMYIPFVKTICPYCNEERPLKTKNLRWSCPQCEEFVHFDKLFCTSCGEERPATNSNQYQLFNKIDKHPSMRSIGFWTMICGAIALGGSIVGLTYVLISEYKHDPKFFTSTTIATGAFTGISVLFYTIGRTSSDMVPVNPKLYDFLGSSSMYNYRLLDDRPTLQEDFQIIGMNFTF